MGDTEGDIEQERLKFLREKESWENDKKKLQQELEVEKLVAIEKEKMQREIDHEKRQMEQEREKWELEKLRMRDELQQQKASNGRIGEGEQATIPHGQSQINAEAPNSYAIDDLVVDDDASETADDMQFRLEIEEGVRMLGSEWDELDAAGKWEGLQALGLFDEQSVEEVNDMLQEIEERHAETDDAQAEKYEVLDQLLEQAQAYPDGQASAGGDDDDDGEELDLESVQRTEELLYSLREQWDNLDADNRWEGLLALGVMLDEDLEEINTVLEDIDSQNEGSPDVGQAEKCDVLENILEQLEDNISGALRDFEAEDGGIPDDETDIGNVRQKWEKMVEENCEPANRRNMLQAFEEAPDDQKYAMLLEWSGYFRKPDPDELRAGDDVGSSSSNADGDWKHGRNFQSKSKDTMSDALKYSLLFFTMVVMLCILFMVLFPDLWNSLTDMANGEDY